MYRVVPLESVETDGGVSQTEVRRTNEQKTYLRLTKYVKYGCNERTVNGGGVGKVRLISARQKI